MRVTVLAAIAAPDEIVRQVRTAIVNNRGRKDTDTSGECTMGDSKSAGARGEPGTSIASRLRMPKRLPKEGPHCKHERRAECARAGIPVEARPHPPARLEFAPQAREAGFRSSASS